MRLIAILSPTNKWGTKTEYTKLKKFLQKDGYIRIAPEVFMRIVTNRKASEKHQKSTTDVLSNSHLKQEPSDFYVLPRSNIKISIWYPAKLIIKKKQLVATVILCYNLNIKEKRKTSNKKLYI